MIIKNSGKEREDPTLTFSSLIFSFSMPSKNNRNNIQNNSKQAKYRETRVKSKEQKSQKMAKRTHEIKAPKVKRSHDVRDVSAESVGAVCKWTSIGILGVGLVIGGCFGLYSYIQRSKQ